MRKLAGLGFILALACTQAPEVANAFSCHRHIYNNTTCPWLAYVHPKTISGPLNNGGGDTWGKGYIEGCAQCGVPTTVDGRTVYVCRIPVGCMAELHLTTTLGYSKGILYIGKSGSDYEWFDYSNGVVDTCPSLDGISGRFALNSPATGDVSINAGCPPPPRPLPPPFPGPPPGPLRPPCMLGLCPQ